MRQVGHGVGGEQIGGDDFDAMLLKFLRRSRRAEA